MAVEIGLNNMLNTIYLVLYAIVGAIAAMIYGLRKIYSLERRLIELDRKLARVLGKVQNEEAQELRLLKKKKR